ncbi:transcriptional regulator, GntR family [Polaromonas sp. OV174]|uniref:GntR family transcriptional regulator n=1 Tax=Polaromonas sp. OV174 TaxID=1855300 RepID=UPI0008E6CF02|nr:GntR family transcriptional regulator [Polaromonas sp. OV174]SFC58797.1 transcriptional regulator, GntR family [Polaromonas sp. OV174]
MEKPLGPGIDVARDTLQQRVAVRLRELLIQGVLAPGDKLNERELCGRLGVSRTPLREAVRLLAAEGLVTLDPGRGAFAPVLSLPEIAHTFDLLAVLEGFAAELAATHITQRELSELHALQLEMQAAFKREDLAAYYRANARVHDVLNEASRNPVLRGTWSQLNTRMHALRFRSNQDKVKWAEALKEHELMIELLQKRDGAALRQLLVQHLHRKRDAVLDRLSSGSAKINSMSTPSSVAAKSSNDTH